MQSVVTADEVVRRFATTTAARARFDTWRSDPERSEVVPAVMSHNSHVVVTVPLDGVEKVCRSTTHALGRIPKSRVASVECIRDWTTPFAATHVLHFITERDGAIPTWQRFRQACQEPPFDDMLWHPAQHAIEECAHRSSTDVDRVREAMQWRIGNFYYSYLREQWVHAYLRQQGIPILQHPLADALYAVDGWFEDNAVSLFIGNDRFRSGRGGRKRPPSSYLADAQPRWHFIDLELPVKRRFGVVHLPNPAFLDKKISNLLRR